MGFTVNFYQFSKRENSTARPPNPADKTYTCTLKAASGVIQPRIQLMLDAAESPASYNFAYIPEFDRYYWVSDWVFDNRLWQANLRVDVLASWKDVIGSQAQYIVRSSAAHDGSITDNLYPIKAEGDVQSLLFDGLDWATELSQGRYVVGVLGNGSSGSSVIHYVLTGATFAALCNKLLSDPSYLGVIEEFSQDLVKALVNPMQYIVSARWFPCPINTGGGTGTIKVGWWDSGVGGSMYGGTPTRGTATVTIPDHPQASARGSYLNTAPYTRLCLYYEPWGTIPIDPFVAGAAVTLQIYVDPVGGVGTLGVYGQRGILAQRSAQVGVPVTIGQVSTDYLGTAITALDALDKMSGPEMFLDPVGSVAGAASGIISAVKNFMPQAATTGTQGSTAVFNFTPQLLVQHFNVVADDNANRGRPLCQPRTPASLGGFMMIADPDVHVPATDTENAQIKAYMTRGFFFE